MKKSIRSKGGDSFLNRPAGSRGAIFKDNRNNAFTPVQRKKNGEPCKQLASGEYEAIQKVEMEEEELVQGKFSKPFETKAAQQKKNETGLPDNLKGGIEALSGMNMDAVRVHQNSTKPSDVGAHAFAQGTDIHLAPGQMKHLPHEAWHVVQQAQGRVPVTTEVGGMPVNDNPALEAEADAMGEKAQKYTKD